jgi:hypothetical protein
VLSASIIEISDPMRMNSTGFASNVRSQATCSAPSSDGLDWHIHGNSSNTTTAGPSGRAEAINRKAPVQLSEVTPSKTAA